MCDAGAARAAATGHRAAAGPSEHAGRPRPLAVELRALEDYRQFAAATIQRFYRGWIVRHRAAKARRQREAAAADAAAAAADAGRLHGAARRIQDAWRARARVRDFRRLRALLAAGDGGDPRSLLRAFNPREAALVEPAAGLHVRFRLGGASWPPEVLYKVFTHRPVADICSFGPRDYAGDGAERQQQRLRQLQQRQQRERGARSGGHAANDPQPRAARGQQHSGRDGSWYSRDDRNGWRPVAERLLLEPDPQAAAAAAPARAGRSGKGMRLRHGRRKLRAPRGACQSARGGGVGGGGGAARGNPGAGGSSSCSPDADEACSAAGGAGGGCPVPFHYSRLVRREERARKIKLRRRQWLLKLYRMGQQQQEEKVHGAAGCAVDGVLAGASTCPGSLEQAQRRIAAPSLPDDEEEQLLQELEQQLGCIGPPHSSYDACFATVKACPGCDISTSRSGLAAGAARRSSGAADNQDAAPGLDASLLAWCLKLDFESYHQHWLATTLAAGSEAGKAVLARPLA